MYYINGKTEMMLKRRLQAIIVHNFNGEIGSVLKRRLQVIMKVQLQW